MPGRQIQITSSTYSVTLKRYWHPKSIVIKLVRRQQKTFWFMKKPTKSATWD